MKSLTPAKELANPHPEPPPARGCSHFKLKQASRLVGRHYDTAMLASTGLKTTQYSLLGHIASMQPVRPGDLADAMGLDASSLSRNLQALATPGWVKLEPGLDARSRLVTLTAAGAAKRIEAQKRWKQAQLAFNERMGAERVARLHQVLDECVQLLQQPATPAR
jgi:DNA-binding MarR family transcriptional regulator